jgi:hypothetical protein
MSKTIVMKKNSFQNNNSIYPISVHHLPIALKTTFKHITIFHLKLSLRFTNTVESNRTHEKLHCVISF